MAAPDSAKVMMDQRREISGGSMQDLKGLESFQNFSQQPPQEVTRNERWCVQENIKLTVSFL